MNHNPTFDMKAIGNGAPDGGHRVKRQFVKQGTHTLPQEAFTARLGPGVLEEVTAHLLCLVNGKSQHHQEGKDDR